MSTVSAAAPAASAPAAAVEVGPVQKDTNISSHVLDTATGLPADALKIQLRVCTNVLEFTGEEELLWEEIAVTQTDNDGRGRFEFDIQPGIYQMRFFTTEYFTRSGVRNFYPLVEVIFRITDVSRHHHVPLLLSPFGYSTYRGS
jgi:5-hydroxyisourate hydrolase